MCYKTMLNDSLRARESRAIYVSYSPQMLESPEVASENVFLGLCTRHKAEKGGVWK